MVKTRGQCSNQLEEEEEVEPPQNEYERSRDRQVAANNKKMQALGLKVLASVFNKSVPPSESRQNKGNKKTNSNNSESSKYHLEDDDQGCTSDDVTELSDGAPMALEIKYPAAGRKAKTKRNNKMPPGSRNIKRVRAGEQPIAQTQRRTSKRLNSSEIDVHNEEQHEDGHGDTTPNLSTPGLTDHDSISVEEDMASNAQELGTGSNEHPLQQTKGPPQRGPRRPRPPTKGKQLEKITKAIGRRLTISVSEGKKDLMNLCKLPSLHQRLASSCGRAFLSYHIGRTTRRMNNTTQPLCHSYLCAWPLMMSNHKSKKLS